VRRFKLEEVESIRDRVVIVTGCNSGVGFEIANVLSQNKARVIIACRDEAEGLGTQTRLGGDAEYINLDLSLPESIDRFVDSVKLKYQRVDVLINNAGVMIPPFTRTSQGLELTFGVNYIGYFLLTNKLMPLMKRVKGSRVVNMSSISQYSVKNIDWANINSQVEYRSYEAYALSNLFRMMFTIELENRLRTRKYETICVACHPGVTITKIIRHIPRIFGIPLIATVLNNSIFQTPYKGAMSALMAATSSEVKGGDFIGLNTKRQIRGVPQIVEPNQLVFDKNLREMLWNRSLEITGVDLE